MQSTNHSSKQKHMKGAKAQETDWMLICIDSLKKQRTLSSELNCKDMLWPS